jgi:hypothetical protein
VNEKGFFSFAAQKSWNKWDEAGCRESDETVH